MTTGYGHALIASRTGDVTIHTSGIAGLFNTFSVTFDTLSTAGITLTPASSTLLETSSYGLISHIYTLTGTDRSETYTVNEAVVSFSLAEVLVEDVTTCTSIDYNADLTWAVSTPDGVHMALGPASSPVSLDLTSGVVEIFSTTNTDAGIYSWVISVFYQTTAGGLLAVGSLTLDVEV